MGEKFIPETSDAPHSEPLKFEPKNNFGDKQARPWQPGQSGNPAGRPRGSRNRLSEAFLADLREAWERHGARALETCALEDPSGFVRTVAGLMPRHVDLNVGVDAAQFALTFRQAIELLGNEPSMLPRRRRAKVIEAEVVDAVDQ